MEDLKITKLIQHGTGEPILNLLMREGKKLLGAPGLTTRSKA